MHTRTLGSPYHYIIALQQLFGVTRAGIPIDVLSEATENVDGNFIHGRMER
ncbi:hypothetical protein RSAG8_07880, partial [Rhizoctonia solani AG-8 WAC10335]